MVFPTGAATPAGLREESRTRPAIETAQSLYEEASAESDENPAAPNQSEQSGAASPKTVAKTSEPFFGSRRAEHVQSTYTAAHG